MAVTMAPSTHVTLLERLSDRMDVQAWQDFHDRYGALLRGFARRYQLQPADCDDVAQEVLLALSTQMDDFKYDPHKGMFRSYLKTLALRAVFKRVRQNRRDRGQGPIDSGAATDFQDEAADESRWEREWQYHHVRRAMSRVEAEFSETNRLAFIRYAVEGRNAREVAALLGITVDQVYQAKTRILKRLSEVIAEQVEAEG